MCRRRKWVTNLIELSLEQTNHILLYNDVLVVEILNDVVMVVGVDINDDGLDGGVALDEDSWKGGAGMLVGRGNIWGRAAGQRGQACGGRHLTSDGAGHPGSFVGEVSKGRVNYV